MDTSLSPAYKRQALLLVATIATGLITMYFFGLLIGMAVNTGLLIALAFYVRKKQTAALKKFGFGSNSSSSYSSGGPSRLKYVCLACTAQVTGVRCGKCGSNMKKPVF
jgi:hypothetical protein